MNFVSRIADFEARDYLAFREVMDFCNRHGCQYHEDASVLCISSIFSGFIWADVPSQFAADSRVDMPHVALLRALVANLEALHEHDMILEDAMVSELLGRAAA